jgi:long-chain acyl-CoA synthetase
MSTQARFLLERFQTDADRTFIIETRDGSTWTYGRFLDDSLRAARVLADLGVRRGELVAFSAENCVELLLLYLGAMHLGARLLPVNPGLHPKEIAEILTAFSPPVLITTPPVRQRLDPAVAATLRIQCFSPSLARRKPEHEPLITFDVLRDLRAASPAASLLADCDDETPFATVLSSGSTALPKGITITYRGLIGNGRMFTSHLGIGRENRFYAVLPMTYLGGVYNLFLLPACAGSSIVADGIFGVPNVYSYWQTVLERGIDTLWFSPTMLSMLLSLEDDDDLDLSVLKQRIKIALVGMAPLPVRLKEQFEARFGFPIHENYALSETTFLTTNRPGMKYKDGSVGTVLPGIDLRLVDAELRSVPTGQDGQVLVRTPYFMKGYDLAGPADLANCKPEGFYTGDVGRFDQDGELFITGRIKDLIIRGGLNISPKQVEDCVYGIEGIEEAACVGLTHPVYGEDVGLAVTLKPGATVTVEAVRKHCDANLANFQRPKAIYILPAMPKGSTGKIQKAEVRRLLMERKPFEEAATT